MVMDDSFTRRVETLVEFVFQYIDAGCVDALSIPILLTEY
jgi:hypothetical protein